MHREGAAILIAAIALSGCASRRPLDAAGTRHLSGVVNFAVIGDPNARSVQPAPNQDYRPPLLLPDNLPPEYPQELLHLALPPQEIVVRAVIGETGDIVTVVPSPLGKSSTGQFMRQFEEAALAAVSRWRFTPAHIRSFRPGDDLDADGRPDSQILTDDSPMTVFLDFRFMFEVREGRGIVRQPPGADDDP